MASASSNLPCSVRRSTEAKADGGGDCARQAEASRNSSRKRRETGVKEKFGRGLLHAAGYNIIVNISLRYWHSILAQATPARETKTGSPEGLPVPVLGCIGVRKSGGSQTAAGAFRSVIPANCCFRYPRSARNRCRNRCRCCPASS